MSDPRESDKAKVWYVVWKIGTMLTLGFIIYAPVVAEGFRMLIPALSKRAVFGLDPAKILAIFLMIAVWHLWEYAIMAYLKMDFVFNVSGLDPKAFKRFVLIVSGVLLFCDAALFYVAMTKIGWRGGIISFTALLATGAWISVLVFVSFVSVCIKKTILEGDRR